MFGKGADEMAAFFDTLEKTWIGKVAIPSVIGETEFGPKMIAGPNAFELWSSIYTPALLDELKGRLDTAANAVAAGSLEARRIAWIRAGFYEKMAKRAEGYRSVLSVPRELKRRETAPADVLAGLAWHLPKGQVRDKVTCVTAEGAVKIEAKGQNVYIACPLKGKLKPNTKYRLSYFIKLAHLEPARSGGSRGACVEYEEYTPTYRAEHCPKGPFWTGTYDWLHQSMEFATGPDADKPACRPHLWLRVFSSVGTVWFDGMRLEEVQDGRARTPAAPHGWFMERSPAGAASGPYH